MADRLPPKCVLEWERGDKTHSQRLTLDDLLE
jgi:hypothetical protein